MCASRLAIRYPLRMRIEHWELSIGQIPGARVDRNRLFDSDRASAYPISSRFNAV